MFKYSAEKNEKLKQERGIDFETIIQLIEKEENIEVKMHPHPEKYTDQLIFEIIWDDYLWEVPFRMDLDGNFHLISAWKNRKLNRKRLSNEKDNINTLRGEDSGSD